MAVVEYRFAYFRFLVTALFCVFSLAAVGLIFALVQGNSVPRLFGFVWLAVFGWNVYWFGCRIAYVVQLQPGQLMWRCLINRGDTAYERIRAVRPMTMASNVAVVDISGRRPLLLFAAKGLADFGAELHALAPHVSVRFGWQARLSERIGVGALGWRRSEVGVRQGP